VNQTKPGSANKVFSVRSSCISGIRHPGLELIERRLRAGRPRFKSARNEGRPPRHSVNVTGMNDGPLWPLWFSWLTCMPRAACHSGGPGANRRRWASSNETWFSVSPLLLAAMTPLAVFTSSRCCSDFRHQWTFGGCDFGARRAGLKCLNRFGDGHNDCGRLDGNSRKRLREVKP
jgi:hypothetical protein